MADQLNRPCSETTAALLQSRGNSIFPKKKQKKKGVVVVARKQDFWLKHKQLVNTNLSEIHCIKQSQPSFPVLRTETSTRISNSSLCTLEMLSNLNAELALALRVPLNSQFWLHSA